MGAPRADVDRLIEVVDLGAEADSRVDRLSGGQRSRVSLGAALVGSSELLILDEHTVARDPLLRRDLWALFRSLADEGTTLLVSSHVMDEATRCDRLLLLREGRLLADDSPDGLLTRTGASNAEQAFFALIGLLAWIFNGTPVFDLIGAPLLGDFLAGYALTFSALAVVQALVATGFAIWVCGLDVAGPHWLLVVMAVVDAVLGTAAGLFVSAFARTEFQAVQFMSAFVLPQFLLCGLLVPRNGLPRVLELFAVGAIALGSLTLRRRTP